MAWFKNAASDAPTPVTLTRLAGALDRIDFTYDLSKDQIGTGFNGFPMKLSLVGDGAFILAEAFAVDKYLPKDRFPEVVRWANSWNAEAVFGTALPILTEDDIVALQVDVSVLTAEGATNEQLDTNLAAILSGLDQTIDSFSEAFGFPRAVFGEEQSESEG